MHPQFTQRDIERFWSKVDRSGGPDACWPWTACCSGNGYGVFRKSGRNLAAHRVAYFFANGDWPEPLGRHTCDFPICCNPSHVIPGTTADNSADMVMRGRSLKGERAIFVMHPEKAPRGDRNGSRLHPECLVRGEANHKAKLTEGNIREIRALSESGWNQRQIARHFGVSKFAIWSIVHGKTWVHVL